MVKQLSLLHTVLIWNCKAKKNRKKIKTLYEEERTRKKNQICLLKQFISNGKHVEALDIQIDFWGRCRTREKKTGKNEENGWYTGQRGRSSPSFLPAPCCIPKHSFSVESVVPSRGTRTSKRASNSSNRLTSNSNTGAVRAWKIPLVFRLHPSQQEWQTREWKREELLFLMRSLCKRRETYVVVE